MVFGQKMRSNLQRHRDWKVSILFEMFLSLSKIQHDIEGPHYSCRSWVWCYCLSLLISRCIAVKHILLFCCFRAMTSIYFSQQAASRGGGWKRDWLADMTYTNRHRYTHRTHPTTIEQIYLILSRFKMFGQKTSFQSENCTQETVQNIYRPPIGTV